MFGKDSKVSSENIVAPKIGVGKKTYELVQIGNIQKGPALRQFHESEVLLFIKKKTKTLNVDMLGHAYFSVFIQNQDDPLEVSHLLKDLGAASKH